MGVGNGIGVNETWPRQAHGRGQGGRSTGGYIHTCHHHHTHTHVCVQACVLQVCNGRLGRLGLSVSKMPSKMAYRSRQAGWASWGTHTQ